MTTHSWILLATAFASKESPADLIRISEVADGINISVPNEIELQDSISWLIKHKMVRRLDNKYKLSDLGQQLVNESQTKTKMHWKILRNLEILLQEYHD